MQWLVLIFAGFLAKIIEFFAHILTKKFGLIFTAITLAGSFTAIFIGILTTAINSIVVAAPGGAVAMGLGLLPGNTTACIAALIVVRVANWLYLWQVRAVSWSLS